MKSSRARDKELIKSFSKTTPTVYEDYVEDFLGTKEYFSYATQRLRYRFDARYPEDLIVDENYFEWIEILDSILSSKDSFTFVEVGAGYGRWSARAYKAARSFGFSNDQIRLITIEPEPVHSEFLVKHFLMNEIPANCFFNYQCAVSDFEGSAKLFNVRPNQMSELESYEWYGQALAYSGWQNAGKIEVPVRKLSRILDSFSDRKIDLIDFDIQGEEPKVLRDIDSILDNVVKIRIGTNCHEDEAFIRNFFEIRNWNKTQDYQGQGLRNTYAGKVAFLDGVLTYVNPRNNQLA